MDIKIFGKSIISVNSEKREASNYLGKLEELVFGENSNQSKSGVNVTDENSLKISAVFACVRLISSTIGALPLHVYKTNEVGKEIAKTHPLYRLLHDESGLLNAYNFRQSLIFNAELKGNGFARIWRDRAFVPNELEILDPDKVEILYNTKSRKIYYRYDEQKQTLDDFDIIHIKPYSQDGIIGLSALKYARESIGLALANQDFGSYFFSNGTNLGSIIEMPGRLNQEGYDRLKKQINEHKTGLKNSHKNLIVEDGGKWRAMAMPAEDAQWIQSRKFQISDIARFFGVQPHKIGDLERSTNNNIEQQSIEFVQDTLLPRLINIEQEFNKKLFKESEKLTTGCSFNVNGLLRADAASRGEFYSKMFTNGIMTINEIRGREDLNIVENGNINFVPFNLQTLNNAILQKPETTPNNGN